MVQSNDEMVHAKMRERTLDKIELLQQHKTKKYGLGRYDMTSEPEFKLTQTWFDLHRKMDRLKHMMLNHTMDDIDLTQVFEEAMDLTSYGVTFLLQIEHLADVSGADQLIYEGDA